MRRSSLTFRFAVSTTAAAVAATVALGALPASATGAPATVAAPTAMTLAPAASLPASELPAVEPGAPAPVTVLQLTDAAGRTTELGEAGLADMEQMASAGAQDVVASVVQGASAGVTTPASLDRLVGVAAATPAENAPEDVAILSQPLATDEFFVAGVTWSGEQTLPAGVQVYLRVMEEDSWTPWQLVEAETLEKDSEDILGTEIGAGGGTAPFVAGGATAVQVQVAAQDAAEVPADLQLTLVPARASEETRVLDEAPQAVVAQDETADAASVPDPAEATRSVLDTGREDLVEVPQSVVDQAQQAEQTQQTQQFTGGAAGGSAGTSAPLALSGAVPAENTELAAVARPWIISRANWGANESQMTWTPRRAALTAAVVHHTAGSNNYTAAQSASVVRGIFYYHAVTRGWGDVGYNFLFDKYGRIYEGRSGSLTAPAGTMVTGAHASGYNTGTVGLSAMGDYSSVWAPQSILDNMARVTAWQFSGAGIDALSNSGIIAPGTNFTAKGTNLPRIFGHRDVANVTRTTCPGPNIARRLGTMRTAVAEQVRAAATPPPVTAPQTPVEPATVEPIWYLNNNFDESSDLQFRFARDTDQRLVGDWDGNGTDTVGVRRENIFYLQNAHKGGVADVEVAYGRPEDQVLVGDWDGDGKDTPAVRRGNVFHLQNDFRGGKADIVIAYGLPDDEILVGDWNGDGKDTLAVRRGTQFLMRNSMTSGVAEVTAYYGRPGDVALVGDWNGDGKDTIGVRRGTEYHLRNIIANGPADLVVLYGRETDEHLVGDWNGDGIDTLGLRRLKP